MIIKKYNRIKKTKPKRVQIYCGKCDRSIVSMGVKCPLCGAREITKHQKK